jgi:ribosomal protein S18 acetylase RimI-like enzyme
MGRADANADHWAAQWRPMTASDLPSLLAIADIVHPNYPEDAGVFAERLRLYPAGCLVLTDRDSPAGYILSHPWFYAQPPALPSFLGALPEKPGTYYIHDIALLPAMRGTGSVTPVITRLIDHARNSGFPNMSLIAVNGSTDLWTRYGFQVVVDPALEPKLRSYDAAARFMVRTENT